MTTQTAMEIAAVALGAISCLCFALGASVVQK